MTVLNTGRSKAEVIQFYLDRNKESVVTLLRSIVGNPTLTDEEQFRSLHVVADHHAAIATLILSKLQSGEEAGLKLASKALSATQNSSTS